MASSDHGGGHRAARCPVAATAGPAPAGWAGNVTEAACSVGFNSLSHFHSCYRERFGAAPAASLRTPSS
ncbi:MAG: hypothetical protein H0X65_14525 [Gemmatimonadetes bacterium]|nr:hypothetical protein [Gemmatimonadota bacterium]